MNLKKLRSEIDTVDAQVVKLLNERAKLTVEVGKLKAKQGSGVYAPDREKAVYDRVTMMNPGPLSTEVMKGIFREIMSGSLALEKPIRIAYLGPPATFTQMAATKKFGSHVSYCACGSITDVFADVEHHRADYGVVPVENSIEGAVTHTLDMLIESSLKVCSEVYLAVSHLLLGHGALKAVKKVYSHPQVFGQCRLWLEAHLAGVELAEVSSTSKAAELAAREPHAAAIASRLAAEEYGLEVLAESIEDATDNWTRFLVIGETDGRPTRRDKTSIVFAVKDRVGALHDILAPFKRHRINLTKIESRPSRHKAWEYYFFVDLEGHRLEPRVKRALTVVDQQAVFLKILGSYPVGE